MDISGKVALVTGASSGIGHAVAYDLAARGARLVVHGRDPRRTQETADRVGGIAITADLADPQQTEGLVTDALAAYGGVDIAVLNAGRGWSGAFATMTQRDIDAVFAVNLHATVRLTQGLLPSMLARGSGYLGFVTSVAGRIGVAGEAVYAASKAALDVFAESLRLEVAGSGVTVGVMVPAAVDTPFFINRGRPYERAVPRPIDTRAAARAIVGAIRHERPEVWIPRWVRTASVVRAGFPAAYRALSTRFGEPVPSATDHDDR